MNLSKSYNLESNSIFEHKFQKIIIFEIDPIDLESSC